jgi:predicted nucleic-acid-binding protein
VIAVDTSILVRYFVQDDPNQAALATVLLETRLTPAEPGLVTLVVIHETYRTLMRVYRLEHAAIVAILQELIAAPNLVVEHRDVVERALAAPVGFADALIHFVGASSGCTKTITFDKKFARLKGVELLAA